MQTQTERQPWFILVTLNRLIKAAHTQFIGKDGDIQHQQHLVRTDDRHMLVDKSMGLLALKEGQ